MSTHTLYCPGVSCPPKPYLPLSPKMIDRFHAEERFPQVVDRLNLEERFPQIYFTPRQVECLQWIAKGYSNRSIGEAMNLSVRTIESHLAVIKCKLNCYSKLHLLRTLDVVD